MFAYDVTVQCAPRTLANTFQVCNVRRFQLSINGVAFDSMSYSWFYTQLLKWQCQSKTIFKCHETIHIVHILLFVRPSHSFILLVQIVFFGLFRFTFSTCFLLFFRSHSMMMMMFLLLLFVWPFEKTRNSLEFHWERFKQQKEKKYSTNIFA